MITCGMLAELIEAVTEPPFGDDSNNSALVEISDMDLMAIDWICRLIPSSTVKALKAHDRFPLWGDGAPEPADIKTTISPSDIDTLQEILFQTNDADRREDLTRILTELRSNR